MKIRTSRRSRKVVIELEADDTALPPIGLPELDLKRILIPVDFSDCSRKAFHYGVHLARQFNAEVLLLHVIVSVAAPPEIWAVETDQLKAKYQEETAKQLSEWRKEIAPALSAKAATRSGTAPYHEIIEAAQECNCDLIVIGNHGRTGLSRMLIGSTAERVVRHAPCPVLVIRAHEHDFVHDQASEAKLRQRADRSHHPFR